MLGVRGVSRSFGEREVLKDVSFDVRPGRLTGFVGSNGAGKTTTMRIILGVLETDAGRVSLAGRPLTADHRRLFGYMPEERGLYPKMRVAEQLIYLARLHGLPAAQAAANAEALLDQLGLADRAATPVESLSLGNQQRAQIAAALVHDPEVLILDEPFSGLDPLGVDTVVNVLKDRAGAGACVLFSSHQLEVVERLCDDLIVIADGEIRAAGPSEELRRKHTLPRYEIVVDGDVGWIGSMPGVEVIQHSGGQAIFEASDPADGQAVLQRAAAASPVTRFAPQRPSLSQIFREVIQ